MSASSPLPPILLFLLLSLYSQSLAPVNAATSITDKEALLSFKLLITDPSDALSSWNENSTFCNWVGVSCDRRKQRVTALDLQNKRLTGTIAPHVGNLSFLRDLHLQSNQFTGTLPDQISNLFRLQILNASSNLFQGSIPPNITRCSDLMILDLTGNQFSGRIPLDLDRLSKLNVLKLGQNQISGIFPPTLANLSLLTTLDFGTNSLHGPIPNEVGRLRNLQHLQISINHLTGTVPLSLYNISSLVTFALASNDLWGEIPADVGFKLPNLKLFNFCINKFTGKIPASLNNVSDIQTIRMAHNLLEGPLSAGIGKLRDLRMYNVGFNKVVTKGEKGLSFLNYFINNTRLEFLAVDGNSIEGHIPESIGNLSNHLTKLYMGGNQIYGTIPASIGRLSNLALLNLSYNSISGEIPQEIGQLGQLQMLGLAGNKLSGKIPESLGNLVLLNELELFGNDLEGEIPTTFGNFQRLLSLDLSNNKLNGSIPNQIFKLRSLGPLLNLSRNSLSGSLPSVVGKLDNLEAMDVSDNQLSGDIPDSIGTYKSLQRLFMAKNSFSGSIPQNLQDLRGLQILDLSSNQLSGAIPVDLQKLQDLHFLNLSFNDLQGEVPQGGIFMNLSIIDLSGNTKLCRWEANQEFQSCYSRVSNSPVLKITVPIASFTILCIVILGLSWIYLSKRKKQAPVAAIESSSRNHRMISYNEIAFATGNFSAEHLIGAGSFGSVYHGTLRDGTQVAVKVLDLLQHGAYKSFLAECDALRNIRHRNLVKLITSCSSTNFKNQDFRALVFEFMPNGSLDKWLHSKNQHEDGFWLSLTERLDIAIDIASALDYLHNDCEPPVVHCDLKPSNVLLDSNKAAKVGDFGLARLITERPIAQQSSTIGLRGSIGYIPPEYGTGGKPSTTGDAYSFGIMLLELFTGKSPTHEIFTGDMNLRKWVDTYFPQKILDVVDPELQLMAEFTFNGKSVSWKQQQSWLVSVIGIGLSCVVESPDQRARMRDVLPKLKGIKDALVVDTQIVLG